MEMLPVRTSPDSFFIEKVDSWVSSNHKVLAAFVSVVAHPPIVVLSALYNIFSLLIKAPITLCRYTIGFIPTNSGKLMDKFPEDTKASQMAWHGYKILMFVVDIGPLYPLAVFWPRGNVLAHRKLKLVTEHTDYRPPLPPRDPPSLPDRDPVDGMPPPLPTKDNPAKDFLAELNNALKKKASW